MIKVYYHTPFPNYFIHRVINNAKCTLTSRYSTPGRYSSKAVHPIALRKVMNIAKMMKTEFGDKMNLSLSGIGGVETGGDAAEFILLEANTVRVVHCLSN